MVTLDQAKTAISKLLKATNITEVYNFKYSESI